jgi:site-specific DNA-methyltransferase (adenine-specific)
MEGIVLGDRLATLRQIPEGAASAVLTYTGSAAVEDWTEIARVLRPGAHAIVFGTWQVGVTLRRVGFEMRDSLFITHGARVVNEVAYLVRRPLRASTVAAQTLATGTGAINIDGTRVRHSSAADFEKHKAGVEALKARGGSLGNSWKNSSDLAGANDVTQAGRWPANAVFAHAPACQKIGSRRVPAPVINRFSDGMKPFGGGAGHEYHTVQTGDADGMEEVASWSCVEDCPISALDSLSGVTRSGAMRREVEAYEGVSNTPFLRGRSGPSNQHGDAGGASRFFRTFATQTAGAIPVELLSYLVQMICPPGGLMLDPYCGLGDACAAARCVGHRFLGLVESESTYQAAVDHVGSFQ